MPEKHSIYDTCYGVVEGRSSYGIYLQLDDNQDAFAYGYTQLATGRKVICSIKRPARGFKRTEVIIDSVIYENAA